eukprot:CAMPEP_0115393992 /NCGR_PEP_ID=MMETSP0271-20121206/12036_1 /TAXON_ID=71861 /ORGANISM="Scrippsiella trochoidea, Strain CCMP3099" /LENGTH=322 /DNA_ID=CAMNT_0002817649 /DNA_START=15 /DNA_END=983 /DNA_ORIENTATION=+
MPARNHAPIRPKLLHRATSSKRDLDKVKPEHGHAVEYFFGVVVIIVNAMFLIGSVCFLKRFPVWVGKLGDWLFLIGSVVTVIQSTMSAHEAYVTSYHPDLRNPESLISQHCKQERLTIEVVENLHFVGASIIFFVGAIFFMPGIYSNDVAEEYGHEYGAWCMIIGSFGYVFASYWNACGVATEHSRLASISLCCAMVGGVFYVAGSFMYRPGYSKDCPQNGPLPVSLQEQDSARQHHRRYGLLHARSLTSSLSTAGMVADKGAGVFCLDAAEDGTWMYIIGSCFFLMQAFFHMACTMVMAAAEKSTEQPSSGSGTSSSMKPK